MNYDATTYRLYEDLFKEAHAGLFLKEGQKQVGLLRRLGRRLFPGREAVRAAEEEAARMNVAVEDAAHRMGLQEADLALARSELAKAEDLAAQRGESLQRFAEDPEALSKAEMGRNIWRGVGIGGLGAGAVGLPLAYSSGRSAGEADKKRTRNIAFGAGAAAGLAAPQLIRGLGHIARGTARTGLFPEMQGYGAY